MSVTDILLELELSLLRPSFRKSSDELERILADDFIEFGSSGKTYNKQQVIDFLANEIQTEIAVEDFSVKMLSEDIALATYKTFHKDSQKRVLRSSVWKKTENSWVLEFHQGTVTI